jgi:crotonobetainyl-CoA:carnitine CoA-transferase CaiB-like acyl-CoA transferase
MDQVIEENRVLATLQAELDYPFASNLQRGISGPNAPTRYQVGSSVASVLEAIGSVMADIVQARGGPAQSVSCSSAAAVASLIAFRIGQEKDDSGDWTTPEPDPSAQKGRDLTKPFATRDGRYFLPHFGLPHLQRRVLDVLDCDLIEEDVSAAIAGWDALDLEEAIADARACGGMVRRREEWLRHPHGAALATRPVISIEKIGEAPPEPIPGGLRPLSGLRVLDLTRILAGPVAARSLAEHGADVLMVAGRDLPQVPEFVRETSHGKRSCFLDLKSGNGLDRLVELVSGADVFSQGYRPGAMEKLGLGPRDLATLRPGIVALSVSCFGPDGPMSDRAGWEQVAQAVTGMCAGQGGDAAPTLVPVPVCDFLTGYLGTLGTLIALQRRATEGGSWHVEVSLCRTAMFLQDQGLADEPGQFPKLEDIAPYLTESRGKRGHLRFVGPVLQMSGTPPRYERPSPVLGQHQPEWL